MNVDARDDASADALLDRSVATIVECVHAGDCAPTDLVRAALHRIRTRGAGPDGLNAVLSVDEEGALHEAQRLESTPRDHAQRLAAMPVLIKDNIATHRLPTSCGSRILEGYVSPYEATAVRRLRDAGAIVIGKTNMDEFAMGSSTENWIRRGFPAARRGDLPRRWPPASRRSRSDPRPAGRYDSRPPSAVSSA